MSGALRRVLLVDGDALAYAAAAATESTVCWGAPPEDAAQAAGASDDDALWTTYAEPGASVSALEAELAALRAAFAATDVRVFLSLGPLFRSSLWVGYKANRRGRRRPCGLAAARGHLREAWAAEETAGLEADDLLSMALTAPAEPGVERICVSPDKDLLGAPGLHGRRDEAGRGRLRRVSRAEADRWHLRQTLTGDAADGYPGCAGVGPVRAERILSSAGGGASARTWRAVVAAFAAAGAAPGDALRQARLARLLRHGEFDADRGSPRLWSPPCAI